MPNEIIPSTLLLLKKYGIFSNITISDQTEHWDFIGIWGQDSPTWVEQELDIKLENEWQVAINAGGVVVSKIPGIIVRQLVIAPKLLNLPALISSPNLASSEAEWKSLDISQKLPSIYRATQELFLPHTLNLPGLNAVSFKKGCYVGQEIIARMEFRGRTKRHMIQAQARTEYECKPGDILYSENKEPIGEIIVAIIKENFLRLLAVISEESTESKKIYLDKELKIKLDII